MNSYLVKTSKRIGMGIDDRYIVKADSVKEAIIKQMNQMELNNKNGANVSFDVTLMEVIE
ncbi:unnamed protein product [Fructobacillus fructosus]|uniref:hypothetical protein n=1 Tax=Fructobacillus fructosus TaxID=1631 RepID=UPI002DB06BA8|nr:unnamed protein product [Fructobacillus fructosus]